MMQHCLLISDHTVQTCSLCTKVMKYLMHSTMYVGSVLYIPFHCVVLCIVCV